MIGKLFAATALAAALALAAAGGARAEIYPKQFHNDYVRTCAAAEGLQQYGQALAAEICHCVVKYLEFRFTYKQMLDEFQKSEKNQRNRFDTTLTDGGRFCEKLMTDPP